MGHGVLRRGVDAPVAAAALALLLGGCESSARLGSLLPGDTVRRQAVLAPEPVEPAPTTRVDSQPLPPPPGAEAAPAVGAVPPADPFGTPAAPGTVQPVQPAQPAPPRVAGLPPEAPPAPASRSAATGNWALTEGGGNRCRATLSSAVKLDLYGASTSGCQARELQRVVAWEFRDSEVVLYESGGAVAARLKATSGGFSGVSTRTGAPITLSK